MPRETQTTNREFRVKRVGWRWLPVFTGCDGIERPLWTQSFAFWSYKRAMTVVMVAQQQWNDGLWVAGGHPLQREAEPEGDIAEDSPEWQRYMRMRGWQPRPA